MLIGYARVSTDDQDLALQRAALKQAGCRRIYEEKVSGAKRDRPQLARLLDQVREQDVADPRPASLPSGIPSVRRARRA
jgi:DNA invertase Pin-like site-specific DNA recombinase